MKNMKKIIDLLHEYYVWIATNNDTDFIHGIIITYTPDLSNQEEVEKLADNM